MIDVVQFFADEARIDLRDMDASPTQCLWHVHETSTRCKRWNQPYATPAQIQVLIGRINGEMAKLRAKYERPSRSQFEQVFVDMTELAQVFLCGLHRKRPARYRAEHLTMEFWIFAKLGQENMSSSSALSSSSSFQSRKRGCSHMGPSDDEDIAPDSSNNSFGSPAKRSCTSSAAIAADASQSFIGTTTAMSHQTLNTASSSQVHQESEPHTLDIPVARQLNQELALNNNINMQAAGQDTNSASGVAYEPCCIGIATGKHSAGCVMASCVLCKGDLTTGHSPDCAVNGCMYCLGDMTAAHAAGCMMNMPWLFENPTDGQAKSCLWCDGVDGEHRADCLELNQIGGNVVAEGEGSTVG
ncbi:hypothetical protein AC578_1489 [Pseudocercospora eumusae]|uniref:Uncharacterized protein n=1 Tax=Pseudocercospora eumusae TaxID=321146 RepID=A0A139H5D6_9PEZI|nr:hypothetical protein AC578_1489 [Pseudocercospora eumusae]